MRDDGKCRPLKGFVFKMRNCDQCPISLIVVGGKYKGWVKCNRKKIVKIE
jgi:hypothetical protein